MPAALPWLIIALAVSMIGIAKSGFGGGLGLIVVPITALALSSIPGYHAEDALGLLLPLLIVGDVIAVWQYRRFPNWGLIARLAPGTIAGIALGTGLIWLLKNQQDVAAALINMEIGFESVLLVSLVWWRKWRGVQQK
ncbi:MAG TPA: TSUP family transporter, partial [Tepidisphaeraceae bacterium]